MTDVRPTIAGQKRPLPRNWIDPPRNPNLSKHKRHGPNHGKHNLPEVYPPPRKIYNQWVRYPEAELEAYRLGRARHSLREISRHLKAKWPDPLCTFDEGAIANLFRTLRKRGGMS